jgi:hypothetical protein
MIDASWLPGFRALFDYVKAAITNVLTRPQPDETDAVICTKPNGNKARATVRRIGYPIAGLALLLIIGPLFIIGSYSIVTSLMTL